MDSLTDQLHNKEVHIASLIIQIQPMKMHEVLDLIAKIENVEVHAQNQEGKIVVCITSESSETISECMNTIWAIPGTLNVVLVYHQIEDASVLDERINIVEPPPIHQTPTKN